MGSPTRNIDRPAGGIAYGVGDWVRRLRENSAQDQADTAAYQNAGGTPGAIGRFAGGVAADYRAGVDGTPTTELAPVAQQPGARDAAARVESTPQRASTAASQSAEPVTHSVSRPDPSGVGATRAIEQGAYQGAGGWFPGAGNATSGRQMAVDFNAHQGINARNAQAMGEIAADERARGNPMDRAIDARRQSNAYESELPYGSTGKVGATFGSYGWGSAGGMDVASDGTGEQQLGVPTIGEARAIEREYVAGDARASAKDRIALGDAHERQREMTRLQRARDHYQQAVANKQITQQDADKIMRDILVESATGGALREGDFAAASRLLFPSEESMLNAGGGITSGQNRQ